MLKTNIVLDSVELKWKDSCVVKTSTSLLSVAPPKPKTMIDVFGIQTILMIVSLGFAYFIYRIKKMKLKNFLKVFVLLLVVSPLTELSVNSYTISTATKESLNFEILDAKLTSDSLTITGWAFINENQHYKTALDHTIHLEFTSLSDAFTVTADLMNLSMTSAYEQLGLPYCAAGVYFSITCNYTYEYVGFTVTVPLSRFKPSDKYMTNIVFLAHNSQTYLKNPFILPDLSPEFNSNREIICTL